MAFNLYSLSLLISCLALALADDERTIIKDHMYLPFKEDRQFAVLSVDPAAIPVKNPQKGNIDVTFYAHRYPGKSFNGRTYKYARHAESWCFDEIGTMWNWFRNEKKQTPQKMFLYTLNSPCHEFCTDNIIKFRNDDPYSGAQWYLGYTKMWKTTTAADLDKLEKANIILYRIGEDQSFESEMKSCVTDFLDKVCESVHTEQLHTYIQGIADSCGNLNSSCWMNATIPGGIANNCNYTITQTSGSDNSSSSVIITGEERLEVCQKASTQGHLDNMLTTIPTTVNTGVSLLELNRNLCISLLLFFKLLLTGL